MGGQGVHILVDIMCSLLFFTCPPPILSSSPHPSLLPLPLFCTCLDTLFAHCRDCSGLVDVREIFSCPECKDKSIFQRSSSDPVNHFVGTDISETGIAPLLMGSCSICNKDNLKVSRRERGMEKVLHYYLVHWQRAREYPNFFFDYFVIIVSRNYISTDNFCNKSYFNFSSEVENHIFVSIRLHLHSLC